MGALGKSVRLEHIAAKVFYMEPVEESYNSPNSSKHLNLKTLYAYSFAKQIYPAKYDTRYLKIGETIYTRCDCANTISYVIVALQNQVNAAPITT